MVLETRTGPWEQVLLIWSPLMLIVKPLEKEGLKRFRRTMENTQMQKKTDLGEQWKTHSHRCKTSIVALDALVLINSEAISYQQKFVFKRFTRTNNLSDVM